MTKQEIEALGQAMVKEHGLSDWTVRAVYEQDDMGDEDDIAGSYGRAFHEERLIWVDMRYAEDPTLVGEILLHEIALVAGLIDTGKLDRLGVVLTLRPSTGGVEQTAADLAQFDPESFPS